MTKSAAMDAEFDLDDYGARVRLAECVAPCRRWPQQCVWGQNLTRSGVGQLAEAGEEMLRVYGTNADALVPCARFGPCHTYGLIHETADLILALPDGRLVVQRRQLHDLALPAALGLSAGGHLGLGKDPVGAALREAKEELSLNLGSRHRLVALHETGVGWPIHYMSMKYVGLSGRVEFRRWSRDEEYVALANGRRIKASAADSAALAGARPWDPPRRLPSGLRLTGHFFNQERAYYYVVPLNFAELAGVRLQRSEVFAIALATVEDLVALAADPWTRTDTLASLDQHGGFERLRSLLGRMRWPASP